jgi:uncharacterized protein YdeI (YjbR/CyaY-like superfamily)
VKEPAKDYPQLTVRTQKEWSRWLQRNHAESDGAWLRFFKKGSGRQDLTYEQALQEALCWGWIDGQSRPLDELSWRQKFTPRRARSTWSKRNRDRIALLTGEGRMKPAGVAAVEAAKRDGRWEQAYDSPSTMTMPRDFLAALRTDPAAYAFFKTLTKANTYAIGYRLQTAKKPETRARRMAALLAMLSRGEKLH